MIQLGKTSGTVNLFVDTFGIPDRIKVFYQGGLIADTTCFATSGRSGCNAFGCCDGEWCSLPITYSGSSSQMTVEVTPNREGGTGTDWSFALSCP